MRSFDTRTHGVLLSELFGFLRLASRVQCFMMLPRLQRVNPWLPLRLGTTFTVWTWPAIFPSKPRLESRAILE